MLSIPFKMAACYFTCAFLIERLLLDLKDHLAYFVTFAVSKNITLPVLAFRQLYLRLAEGLFLFIYWKLAYEKKQSGNF